MKGVRKSMEKLQFIVDLVRAASDEGRGDRTVTLSPSGMLGLAMILDDVIDQHGKEISVDE
jgi:hypothetical protein